MFVLKKTENTIDIHLKTNLLLKIVLSDFILDCLKKIIMNINKF